MNKKLLKTAKKLLKTGEANRAAVLFEKAGDPEKALEAYIMSRNFLRAAEIAISIGKGEEAAEFMLKAKRFDMLGEFYEVRKNYQQAAHYYKRCGDYKKAADMYEQLLKAFPELKDIPGVLKQRSTEEVRVCNLAASAHSRAGNYQRAAELYHRIERFEEEAKNHHLAKKHKEAGEAYSIAGQPAKAGQAFAEGGLYVEAGECFKTDGSYRLAAENYMKAKKHKEAGKLFEKAGDVFLASEAYEAGNELDLAIKILSFFTSDHPDYIKAVKRIIHLVDKKHYVTPAAKRVFNGMVSFEYREEFAAICFKIASLLEHSDFIDEARLLYRKIQDKDPAKFQALKEKQKEAASDQPFSTDYNRILTEDFDAETREKHYQEMKKKMVDVKESKPGDSTDTLAGEVDATLSSGAKQITPLSFMHIQEGQKLGDRYLILKHLGSGGMGTVYMAKDLELDELVAIKILSPQLNIDDNAVARFKQEIKLARQINHQNVIRIHDLGELFGIKFITMEYFPGEQVKKLITDRGFFSVPAGLDLVLKVCAGLNAAHKKGIIHRDIKSQNIMISEDGIVKVLDFGIAKCASIPGLTTDGSILGTPEYISPEAITQKPVDVRSDIYSLGIVMFEVFTGVVPYR
ncbi:protein kinase, partial [bacterium]|nr:protein kinase [candidate division CSSED10-310 bacterium]